MTDIGYIVCGGCHKKSPAAERKCVWCGSQLLAQQVYQTADQIYESAKLAPPNGHTINQISNQAVCPECHIALIAVERNAIVSIAGIISVMLFLIGLLGMLFFSLISGLVIWILAAIIGLMKNKHTVLVCPACKKDIVRL